MPVTIEQVRNILEECDLSYREDADNDAILIRFGLDAESTTFRDVEGNAAIFLVIGVAENGEFLWIAAPHAWNVEACPHRAAVFEACTAIQTQYKMLRFEYDPMDGEVRPNVHLPLEDAEITATQFHRLMQGLLHGVQRYDGVIRHAMQTGEVSFASLSRDEAAGPSGEIARLQKLAEEAGGVEALELLASGGVPVETPVAGAVVHEPLRPPVGRDAVPPPKAVIARIWEWLFGDRKPGAVRTRQAG